MIDPATGLLVTTTGLVTAFGVRPVLGRLPEPDHGDVVKVAYRDLASCRFIGWCTAFALLGAVVTSLTLPVWSWPVWSVLNTTGVLLVAIDARTTWLPLRLTQVSWGLAGVAVGAGAVLAHDPGLLLRCALGAAAAGGLYFLGWLITRGGFGFGDVRFAPLLGAAAASQSWTLLLWALVLGTVVGGMHGGVRLAGGRRGEFPYAPAMLAGAYLAAVTLVWLPG